MELRIIKGDITTLSVDAIVNAANKTLMGGGGVDGAIHRASGPMLKEACKGIRDRKYPIGLPVGEAVITKGYNLEAKYVIHTVGPIYNEYDQKDAFLLLKKAYENCFKVAEENGLRSVAFPAISTGAYGFPKEYALKVVEDVLETFPFESVSNVILCFYGDEDYKSAKKHFDETQFVKILYKKETP